MKHAGAAALDRLEGLLAAARATGVLRERSRGVFYLKSKAFLHFHEDPAGLFAMCGRKAKRASTESRLMIRPAPPN